MRTLPSGPATDTPPSPTNAAALRAVSADLAALETLLGNASRRLFTAFAQASHWVNRLEGEPAGGDLPALRQALSEAAVALQFEDLAQQKLAHAQSRLQGIAASLPTDAGRLRSHLPRCGMAQGALRPVEQADVRAGSIDFF